MNKTIAATILTFNRLEFLKEIIQAVRNQTLKPDEIIVVNNSSTDGTLEWLEEQDDLFVVTQDNTGSSGGQYTGFKTAYDRGHEWIWTMDDDVVPRPDCLEKLMENRDPNLVRTPLRITVEGGPFLNDTLSYNLTNPLKSIWVEILSEMYMNDDFIPAVGITFEGPCFHRSLIEKIGLPEKKFFIYADDGEFFIRAWKAGYKSGIITAAKLDRKLPVPDLMAEFSWKNYYVIRNIIAIDVLHGSPLVRWIRPWGYLISWLGRCKTIDNLKTVLRAFKDGYFYKSEN
jgi:rhamnopyranosyl-N-acetylglucosaminyl-diphospho-decaprenol beta-1,3/1,4-galactofuranosyltransferase